MELARITVFLESERDSWPYKRILQSISSSVGYVRSFISRNLKTFWIRMPLGPLKLGQRNRKCSLISFSRPHLQIGEEQSNLFLKRWSRRSLWPTRRQVRYFIPCRSEEIGIVFFLRSLVSVDFPYFYRFRLTIRFMAFFWSILLILAVFFLRAFDFHDFSKNMGFLFWKQRFLN